MSKNKSSKQLMILFGFITLILCGVIINVYPEKNQANISNFEPQSSMNLDPYIYEPLQIDGNEELELLNFSGTGENWDDPYIIEGLNIVSNTSHFAINLKNITKYVLIQNCHLYLTTPYIYNSSYAIFIDNSAHISIESCNFHESSLSYSYAIKVNNSEDIIIKNNNIDYFAEGIGIISSKNCIVEENDIDYIINNGIMIEKSENITIFNNYIKGRYAYGWWSDGIGVSSRHSTYIKIQNNHFSFLYRFIDLVNNSKNIIFENEMGKGNLHFGISGVDVFDCEIYDNILEDTGIQFSFSSDISIFNNTISRSEIAIKLYSVNSVRIESNTILYPEQYAFKITNSSDIIIKLNIFRGISLSIFSPDSTMKTMQFNYIFPSFSYIIIGIALISILFLSSIVYFNFKKQSEKISVLQDISLKSLDNNEIENELENGKNQGDNLNIYKSSSKFLLDYEKLAFRKFCSRIYLVIAILMPLSLRIIIYPRSLSGDLLRFINGDQLYNEIWILHLISNLLLMIFWLIGVLFIYRGAKKVLPQNIFKIKMKIQKKEKIFYAIFIGISIILWFLFYFLSMRYGFIIGWITIGVFCLIGFIPILYLPFKHKWVELPIIGIILLIILLFTNLNIDFSTMNEFNVLQGIQWVYWLLFIGSSIGVWITALDKYESFNNEQEINQIQ